MAYTSDTAAAVEQFLFAAEGLDEKACQALRAADPETQKSVLARGDLTGTRDPSAALIARIRNKGLSAPWGFGKGAAGGGPTVDVEAYLAENHPLDERAQTALRTAPSWVQAGVVAGGSVAEAKNPSAALISRLNTVQTGGGGGGGWGADPWGMGAWGMGGWGGGKGWGSPWDMGWGKGGGKDPWSIGFQMGFGGGGGGGGGGWGGKSWSGGWDHKAEPTSRFLLFDLPEGASEEGIREYFGAFAKIEEVTLKKIESNGKIVGSVKFASPTDDLRNQMLKQPHQMLGTTITVQTYKMQKQQKPGYAAKREAETAKYLEEKAASWAAKSKGKGSAYMAY